MKSINLEPKIRYEILFWLLWICEYGFESVLVKDFNILTSWIKAVMFFTILFSLFYFTLSSS